MVKTLDQFVEKQINKVCTHPRGIRGQCVCLIRRYFDDVLEAPQFRSVRSAKDLWQVLDKKGWVKVPNSLFATPRKGDIFVIDAFRGNPHGHTGIVLSSNMFNFQSFDSNWSTRNVAKIERHGYRQPRVLGWFRRKTSATTLSRVNEALRAVGDDPTRSVGTLTLSRWWQKRVARSPRKFTNDEAGYQALIGAISWHQANKRYPHDI